MRIRSLGCVPQILRAKSAFGNTELEKLTELTQRVIEETEALAKEFTREAT
jgi:hypothetical protein